MVYCAWNGTDGDVPFDAASLGACLEDLPTVSVINDSTPLQDSDLMSLFTPSVTDCAAHCVLAFAEVYRSAFWPAPDNRTECAGLEWTDASVDAFASSITCIIIAQDAATAFNGCAYTTTSTTTTTTITTTTTPLPTYLCPSDEVGNQAAIDLVYCAWNGTDGDVPFNGTSLAVCLEALPTVPIDGSAIPLQDSNLLSLFSPSITECAANCLVAFAEVYRSSFWPDPDNRTECAGLNWTDASLDAFASSLTCIIIAEEAASAYSGCTYTTTTSTPVPTYQCPSDQVGNQAAIDLVYCAWNGTDGDVPFSGSTLGTCLQALPTVSINGSAIPLQDLDLVSLFTPTITDCASHCLVAFAEVYRFAFWPAPDNRTECAGLEWTDASVDAFASSITCIIIAQDAATAYSDCMYTTTSTSTSTTTASTTTEDSTTTTTTGESTTTTSTTTDEPTTTTSTTTDQPTTTTSTTTEESTTTTTTTTTTETPTFPTPPPTTESLTTEQQPLQPARRPPLQPQRQRRNQPQPLLQQLENPPPQLLKRQHSRPHRQPPRVQQLRPPPPR